MRTVRVALLLIAGLASDLGAGQPVRAQLSSRSAGDDIVPGVVVVKLKRSGSPVNPSRPPAAQALPSSFTERGVVTLKRAFPSARSLTDAEAAAGRVDLSLIHYASIRSDRDPRAVAALLARLPEVEYAEPKYRQYLCDVPNDSDYAAVQHVYFERMNVPAAWSIQKGSPTVVIAVIDGGTNWNHPDLLPNLWINAGEDINHNGKFDQYPFPPGDLNGNDDDHNGFVDDVIGWNFALNSNNPMGFQTINGNHGTATASAFGAATNNLRGMAGTSWNCRMMPICAADPARDGEVLYGYEGIQYAFSNGARVINCSWGRPGQPSQYEQDVINAATQAGAVVVAAASDVRGGANSDALPWYPASYKNVLSVGATADTSDAKPGFSDFGVNITVFAPGVNIWSAKDDGSYGWAQGTSLSSPLVAGLAGLLAAGHPQWTPDQIAGQIRMTADDIDPANPSFAGSLGHGRVNFGRALSEVHACLEIDSAYLRSATGKAFVLSGDTLVLTVAVKNVQHTPAQGILFQASSTDPALRLLQAGVPIAELDSGQEVLLPDIVFTVGAISAEHDILVRLSWGYNTTETDARVFVVPAFPATGYWHTQATFDSGYFYTVKAVDSCVAWAAGGENPAPYRPLVVRTTDAGTTWTDVTGNLPTPGPNPSGQWANDASITAVDAERAWIGAWGAGIFATTNGGLSWNQQTYPGQQCWAITGVWFFDAHRGYAMGNPLTGGTLTVLQTSDGGTAWSHLSNEPVVGTDAGANFNGMWCADTDHIWFGTSYYAWRTTDAGANWAAGSEQMPGACLSFRDNTTGISAWGYWLDRSTDGGATWGSITNPTNDFVQVCYAPGSGSAWIASGQGVYRTDDDGTTWTPEPMDKLAGKVLQASFADPGSGWFVTDRGEIVRYRSALVTGVPRPPAVGVPRGFYLGQSYPNPCNPGATIRFGLPRRAYVSLNVFNILGQQVSTLVNADQQGGEHSVRFDGSGLASGVYFYQIRAGSFVQTRKLLLLR